MARLSGAEVLVLSNVGEPLARSHSPRNGGLPDGAVQQVAEDMAGHGGVDGRAEVVSLEVDGTLRQLVVTRILVAGHDYGQLVLLEPTGPTEEHDLAQHTVMSEQGVSLTGSEYLSGSIREAEERARNDFVHALLHNRFTDGFELAARAEHYQFPVDGRFAVFIVSSPEILPDDPSSRRLATELARSFRNRESQDDLVSLSALIGPMIVVVRQIPAPSAWGSDPGEGTWLREFGEHLHRVAGPRLQADVRVAYGRACHGVARRSDQLPRGPDRRGARQADQHPLGGGVRGHASLRRAAGLGHQ